jgi:hypothetical protein
MPCHLTLFSKFGGEKKKIHAKKKREMKIYISNLHDDQKIKLMIRIIGAALYKQASPVFADDVKEHLIATANQRYSLTGQLMETCWPAGNSIQQHLSPSIFIGINQDWLPRADTSLFFARAAE